MPSRTLFGVHVILTGVGIQALFVLYKWLPTAKTGDGQMRIPRFSNVVTNNIIMRTSDVWVPVR